VSTRYNEKTNTGVATFKRVMCWDAVNSRNPIECEVPKKKIRKNVQYEEREERKRTQKKKTIEWHKGSKRKGEKLTQKDKRKKEKNGRNNEGKRK